jgi:hypothetical protein
MAGFLTLPEKPAFPTPGQWLLSAYHNGDDSSGYCSGLSPDSLLCTGETPAYHHIGCKVTTFFDKQQYLCKKSLAGANCEFNPCKL